MNCRTSQEENKTIEQKEVAAEVDKAESSQSALPAFKKESGLSEAEKLRNPLIVNHTGLVQVVTNMKGERLGVAQIVKLSEKDFDSIGNTGRALQITGKGSVARYGYINAFEDAGIDFGKFHETVREFFYLSDENDFQYFNSYDPDDAGLKRFKDSDKVFAAKIN